jgi:uncharacterized hydrophobic protein (TIGR00271 family)
VYQVRLTCAPEQTADLVGSLTADPGVRNLVVLPGMSRCPDGDSVQFDLLVASANPVLLRLRELGQGDRGPATIQVVDTAIGDPEMRAGRRRWHQPETAPVWEVSEGRIRGEATYAPSFFLLLVIAGLIAGVGILTNSQILIVAAMVVGPEYSAIVAVALGIDKLDWPAIRTGLEALGIGFSAAIIATLAFAVCVRATGKTPEPYLAGIRPVSDLINSPNVFSVVVAVLAGIVGVVSLTEARANALIGVFISVTTIPAAAGIGVSLGYQSWHEAGGSALQLALNVGLLIVTGAGTLRLQRRIWRRRVGPE